MCDPVEIENFILSNPDFLNSPDSLSVFMPQTFGSGGADPSGGADHQFINDSYTYNYSNYSNNLDIFGPNCNESGFRDWVGDNIGGAQYYSYPYRIIGTLFQGIIFLVGIIGNILVVFVVARTKSMHSTTNCYLLSLAVADCIVLVSSVPNEILFYYLIGNRWIWGALGCSIFTFLQNLGINASSLNLTAFTVERYIAICHPMKAQTICTVNRAKKIIFGVWVFATIYSSPWFMLATIRPMYYWGQSPDLAYCTFKLSRKQYLGYYFADLIVFYVFPLILSVVLYSLIARILFQSQQVSKTPGSSNKANGMVDSTKTNQARAQVVKMLALVVLIFAVLWLPYRGMLVYNSFATWFDKEAFLDLWFLMFAKTCVYINSAINPILYNAMSVKFRRAFGRTLSCGKNRDNHWPYCRTHTNNTMMAYTSNSTTTNSTRLPSSSTLCYNLNLNDPHSHTRSPSQRSTGFLGKSQNTNSTFPTISEATSSQSAGYRVINSNSGHQMVSVDLELDYPGLGQNPKLTKDGFDLEVTPL